MTRVRITGTELHVLTRGEGPPLLLVHGFPLDHSMWRHQIADLSQDFRVIAPDLRGFGASTLSEETTTITMQQFADDLSELLTALGVREPVVFCGLSMGGYIGWQFERRHPEWLRALIQCDTRAVADSPEVAGNRRQAASDVLAGGPEVLAGQMVPRLFCEATLRSQPDIVTQTAAIMRGTNRRAIAAALLGMAERPDMTSALAQIHVPTLLLCGAHDVISPPAEMRSVAAAIPNARFVEIPDAGHMAPLEQPLVVNQAIRSLL